jgi:oxygen-dependent protoporphyrinogen oxidase
MKKICIIGGGISGLSIALKHHNAGNKVSIFESSNKLGGVVQSVRKNGFLMDYGPNTLNIRAKKTKALLKECSAWEECIDANPQSNKRMIIREKKIVDLPQSAASFLNSPFLSFKGKLRLLLEPFIRRSKSPDSESVAAFIERRFGTEVLNYGANPFLAGIYAAKPESLNLSQAFPKIYEFEKKYRSIILGIKRSKKQADNPNLPKTRLVSFSNGMQELAMKLGSTLTNNIFLESSVKKVTKRCNNWLVTTCNRNLELSEHEFDQVISTIPSHKIKSIEWENIENKKQLDVLSSSTHHPLALVFLGYKRKDVTHPLDGFGFLVPEVENMKILGTLFSSTLFPNRAPEGQVLLTTFVGGERDPELAKQTNDQILSTAKKELVKILGITGEPTLQEIKKWSKAIPLPDDKMILSKKAAEKIACQNPGLSFSGSYLSGVSLPNCLDPF